MDILGRKRKVPYLKEVFAADVPSMRAFQALRVKLSRDYLIFFRSLEKTYQVGKFKGEAKAATNLVLSTIRIVDKCIRSGAPEKEDVEDIIASVDSLNAQRDFFVSAAREVSPIRKRLEEVEEETGVSPEALSVTEEMIQRGVRAVRRERREIRRRARPFRRAMPRTMELAARLARGVGVAMLGPLYPVAEMIGAPVRDIFGLGRAALRRVRERRERRLGELLEPMAMGYPVGELERGAALRGLGLPVPKIGGISRRQAVTLPFRQFFDKEAYRAKWTRELLKEVKKLSKVRAGLTEKVSTGLTKKLRSLGGAMAPLIGKGGLIAGLGVAAGTVGYKLGKAALEYVDSLGKLVEAQDRSIHSMNMWKEHLDALLEKEKKEKAEAQRVIEWMGTREAWLQVAPKTIAGAPFTAPSVEEMRRIKRESTEIIREAEERGGVSGLPIEKQRRLFELVGIPVTGEITSEMIERLDNLIDSMKDLSSKMETRRILPSIKEPGLGNPFDSTDVLLVAYSSGKLTLAEV